MKLKPIDGERGANKEVWGFLRYIRRGIAHSKVPGITGLRKTYFVDELMQPNFWGEMGE